MKSTIETDTKRNRQGDALTSLKQRFWVLEVTKRKGLHLRTITLPKQHFRLPLLETEYWPEWTKGPTQYGISSVLTCCKFTPV